MFPTRLSLGMGTQNTDCLGVFRHLEDETTLPPGRPLLRRGHQARRDKGKVAQVFRHPVDDTGVGTRSVTLSQVFRHAEDDTTSRSAGLSSSMDTQYR